MRPIRLELQAAMAAVRASYTTCVKKAELSNFGADSHVSFRCHNEKFGLVSNDVTSKKSSWNTPPPVKKRKDKHTLVCELNESAVYCLGRECVGSNGAWTSLGPSSSSPGPRLVSVSLMKIPHSNFQQTPAKILY